MSEQNEPDQPPQTSWWPKVLPNAVLVTIGAAALLYALFSGDPAGSILYGIAGFVLVMVGAVKLLRRPRLEVVDGALAIKGLRSVRFVPPSSVVEIRVIGIPRFGLRQDIMRVEYSDEEHDNRLEIFSKGDLGVEPADVVDTLGTLGFPVRESDLPGRAPDAEHHD